MKVASSAIGSGEKLQILDEYKVPTIFNLNNKWHKINTHLDKALAARNVEITKKRPADWYINFLSGSSGGACPFDVAKNKIGQQSPMNPRLFDFLQSQKPGRFGTLLMDFPDDALISTIISLNEDIRPIGK